MPRGGHRPGAGRPPGARNKRTQDFLRALEEGGVTPLNYLLSVMRNESEDPTERFRAAVSALPYCHPRITPIDADFLFSCSMLDEEPTDFGKIAVDELVDRLYSEARKTRESPEL